MWEVGKAFGDESRGSHSQALATTVNSVTKSRHVVSFSKEPIYFLLCKRSRIYDLYLPFQF